MTDSSRLRPFHLHTGRRQSSSAQGHLPSRTLQHCPPADRHPAVGLKAGPWGGCETRTAPGAQIAGPGEAGGRRERGTRKGQEKLWRGPPELGEPGKAPVAAVGLHPTLGCLTAPRGSHWTHRPLPSSSHLQPQPAGPLCLLGHPAECSHLWAFEEAVATGGTAVWGPLDSHYPVWGGGPLVPSTQPRGPWTEGEEHALLHRALAQGVPAQARAAVPSSVTWVL